VLPLTSTPSGRRPRLKLRGTSPTVARLVGLWLGAMGLTCFGTSDIDQLKRLSVEELMGIEVTTVSRSPLALAKAPSALQVITDWEIRRSGATNLPEALRLANNLSVARKNSHDWGISARGFNTELANKLLVMIDGRAVYTPLWSGVRWDVQDYLLEDIDRIEVVSGPGGSLWGANAVNGVINVTTKPAAETQGFYVEAGGGNQLRDFEAVRYGGKLAPGVFFRVYGKHFRRADEAFANGRDAGDHSDIRQGGFRIDADSPELGELTVQGDFYRGREGVVGTTEGHVAGGNILSRWSKTFVNGSDVQLQLYYDRAFLGLPVAAGAFAPAGRFTDDLETYDLDLQHSFRPEEAHSIVWGVGYRFMDDESTTAPNLGFDPPAMHQDLISGFVQDQIALSNRSLLTIGTKIEHTHYTGWEVEPSVRVQRDLGRDNMIWGAISRAVRTPSRIDRDVRQPSSGVVVLAGSNRFESETLIAYEVGLRGQLGPKVAGSVSTFHNDYNKIRSLAPTPQTLLPFVILNDVQGHSYGVEFSFDADVQKWWRLHGGYTFLRTELGVRPGGIDINNALNETSDPESQVYIGSAIDLPQGVQFDAQLRWVDTLENNNNGQVGTVPSYTDLTLRVALHVTENLEASIVGHNLLHDQHPEFGVPAVARVEIRRSVFGKLAWRY
jgi:iron complex outermembrane receptor protein